MTRFIYMNLEIPEQGQARIAAASEDHRRSALRDLLGVAHTMAAALDGIASEIAEAAGLEPDSDQITEAVFNLTDVDTALAVLGASTTPAETVQ